VPLANYNKTTSPSPTAADSRFDSTPRRSGCLEITGARASRNKLKNKRRAAVLQIETPAAMIRPGANRQFQFHEYTDLSMTSRLAKQNSSRWRK
jgi:hypothetical protein